MSVTRRRYRPVLVPEGVRVVCSERAQLLRRLHHSWSYTSASPGHLSGSRRGRGDTGDTISKWMRGVGGSAPGNVGRGMRFRKLLSWNGCWGSGRCRVVVTSQLVAEQLKHRRTLVRSLFGSHCHRKIFVIRIAISQELNTLYNKGFLDTG